MKYLSFRWLISIFLIFGIIFTSIGIVKDIQPCIKNTHLNNDDNTDDIEVDNLYNDISKNIPYIIPSKKEQSIPTNLKDRENKLINS